MNTSWLHFQIVDSPSQDFPVAFPWALVRQRIRQCQRQLLATQWPDGCWFDPQEHRVILLSESLIAVALIPRSSLFPVADRVDELLSLRQADGSWDTADETLVAYLALILHQVPDRILRPTRDWLVAQPHLVPSTKTRLLLIASGQMPYLTLGSVNDLESESDRTAGAILMHQRSPEHPRRDAVISHVLRALVQIEARDRRWHHGTSSSRRLLQALLDWIDRQDREPIISVLPILALHHAGGDRHRAYLEKLLLEFEEAIRDPGKLPMSHFGAERDTTDAFRILIETGLPLEHDALAAADSWIWSRFTRAAADRHVATPRLARLLLALASHSTPLMEDRAFVMPHVWNDILDRQLPDGSWSSSAELTGIILECFGHYGVGIGQPVVEDALHFLTSTQTSRGCWSDDRPIAATAHVIRGLLHVGLSCHAHLLRSAREALQSALPAFHEVAIENPRRGLANLAFVVDVLLAAEAPLDDAMCETLMTLADARPRGVSETAWVLRALSRADRCFSTEVLI